MKNDTAVAVAELMGTLAGQIDELKSNVRRCADYINDAHQRHDDLIASLDEIIRQQSVDLQADVQGIHDRLVSDWPEKPYFMRKNY